MLSKEEIFVLINKRKFDDLFDALREYFGEENDILNKFIDDFTDPPQDFKHAAFATKLRVFVSAKYKPAGSTVSASPAPEAEGPDFYAALCKLDFKLQTEHFTKIYKFKN